MESIIHCGIKCHDCQVFPIKGIRYKCVKCQNFYLCEKCEAKNGQNHGHALLKIRNAFQDNLYQEKYDSKDCKLRSPATVKPTFNCVNSTLNFKTVNNNNFITVPIKLLNNGRINWPLPCYFRCQEELSEIKGEKIKIIKSEVKPGKDVEFKVKIDLSNINKTGDYSSVWRLEDGNGVAFGPKVTIKVNDVFQEKLQLKPFYLIKQFDLKLNEFQPTTTEKLLSRKKNL